MATGFDPYHRWLSIPPSEQPPNHYRLPGLQAFESSVEVIENAAARQSTHVRRHLESPLRPYAVNLLREIEVARLCLAEEETRDGYDAWLRTRIPGSDVRAAAHLPVKVLASGEAAELGPADISRPTTIQSTPQGAFRPAIVTSKGRYRRRRSRSPVAFLLLWFAGGMMGLLAGYAILCMIDPQYDFLNLVFKSDLVTAETTASRTSPPKPVFARHERDVLRTNIVDGQSWRDSSGKIPRTIPPNLDAMLPAGDTTIGVPTSSKKTDGLDPQKAVVPLHADRKLVRLPFDLKKRVLRVVALTGEPVPQNIVCDVEGSGELSFAPLLNLALGEKRTVLFQTGIQDVTVGAEIQFLQRNDLVMLEVRPKYRLPSGDEEALYKSAGLRKIKLVSNQVAMASSAQQSLPNLHSELNRVRTEYQAVLPTANSATTGMDYMRITAAQLRVGTLQKRGVALEDQVRDAETMAAMLPRLQSDLTAVRGLGEWSARIATTATLSVSIHADGVGILAEAR